MAKALPKYKVEVSFTASNTTGLVWSDITTDVRLYAGVTMGRGRTDQFQDVTAGTFGFTVDNMADTANGLVAGRYSPDNTSGPHFPNVTRGRAVRVSAIEDVAVGYTQIYYGFIDSIIPGFDNETGLVAYAAVSCVDLSSMLSRANLSGTPMDLYIGNSGPSDWWPMDDPVGSVVPLNVAGPTRVSPINQTFATPNVTYQVDGMPYGDDGHAVLMDGSTLIALNPSAILYDFTVGWSLQSAFQIPQHHAGTIDLITLADSPAFTNFVALTLDNTGSLAVTATAGTISEFLAASPVYLDTAWHDVILTFSPAAGGTLSMFVDGVFQIGASGVGTASAMPIFYLGQSLTNGDQYALQHCAAWRRALTATEAQNISGAPAGYAGETSVQRVQRIANLTGYTPTIIGAPVIKNMAPWHDTSSSIWAMLSLVNKTEGGILFIDPTGAVTFRTRLAQYNQSVALTLASGTYEDTLKFIQDATGFYNDFVATAYGSTSPQEVTNATSVGNDGLFNSSESIESLNDLDALSYAQIQVGAGKAVTRLPQLDVDLISQQVTFPGLLAAFWALDLGEVAAVTAMPSAAPATALSLIFEGYSSTLTDTSYDATFNLSAAQLAAWVLQDATFGVLNATTVLA